MYIIKAEQNQIDNIVGMSVRVFETDINCGGKKGDYPPEYESIESEVAAKTAPIVMRAVKNCGLYAVRTMQNSCLHHRFAKC